MDVGGGMYLIIAVAALASVLACWLAWRLFPLLGNANEPLMRRVQQLANALSSLNERSDTERKQLLAKVDDLSKVVARLNERSDTDLKKILGEIGRQQETLDWVVGKIERFDARVDTDLKSLMSPQAGNLEGQPVIAARKAEGAMEVEPLVQPTASSGLRLVGAGEPSATLAAGDGNRPRILFALAHPGFLRNFADVVEHLARHASVHVHFAKQHRTISLDDYRIPVAPGREVTCSFGQASSQVDQDAAAANAVRLLRDVLAYSRAEYRMAEDNYNRFGSLQKGGADLRNVIAVLQQAALDLPAEARVHAAEWLARQESRLAPASEAQRLIACVKPDLVVVSPYVNFAAREVDVVKAAKARGIPTVLAVASWDNLTNKGVIKVLPDYVAVWNSHMATEAVELHAVPSERIWVTGATVFDPWFKRRPTRDRESFCRAAGLDPRQRILVYMCSSESIAGPDEYRIVRHWMDGLDGARLEEVRSANIVVRQHPMNLAGWQQAGNVGLGRAAIWPASPRHPTTEEGRAEFYDTLFHADAIVGLNTSAMIEAAILRKPVLTFRGHAAEGSQTGNQHFKYLASRGPVIEASGLGEHVEQLCAVMTGKSEHERRCNEFISDFVRPNGPETSASSLLARRLLEIIDTKMLEAAQ